MIIVSHRRDRCVQHGMACVFWAFLREVDRLQAPLEWHARCKNARFLVEELLCKWDVCPLRAV